MTSAVDLSAVAASLDLSLPPNPSEADYVGALRARRAEHLAWMAQPQPTTWAPAGWLEDSRALTLAEIARCEEALASAAAGFDADTDKET